MPFGVVGDTLATKDPDLDDEEEETHVYEKHDKLLHGDRRERKLVNGLLYLVIDCLIIGSFVSHLDL